MKINKTAMFTEVQTMVSESNLSRYLTDEVEAGCKHLLFSGCFSIAGAGIASFLHSRVEDKIVNGKRAYF